MIIIIYSSNCCRIFTGNIIILGVNFKENLGILNSKYHAFLTLMRRITHYCVVEHAKPITTYVEPRTYFFMLFKILKKRFLVTDSRMGIMNE